MIVFTLLNFILFIILFLHFYQSFENKLPLTSTYCAMQAPSRSAHKCNKIVPSTRCPWNCSFPPDLSETSAHFNTKGEASGVAHAGVSSHIHDSSCRLLLGCKFTSNVCFKHLSSTLYPTASVCAGGGGSARPLGSSVCESCAKAVLRFLTIGVREERRGRFVFK